MIEIKPTQIEHVEILVALNRRVQMLHSEYADRFFKQPEFTEIETDTWAFKDSAQVFFKQFGFQPKIILRRLDINSNKKESLNNLLQPTA